MIRNNHQLCLIVLLVMAALVASCGNNNQYARQHEDKQAKHLLQGIWLTEDGETPVFMAKGDSIFYADSTSMPAKFWIYGDSLYVEGQQVARYLIMKQAPHVFKFRNQAGDSVLFVKAPDMSLKQLFAQNRPYALNIFRTEDTDTTARTSLGYFKSRIHIESTSDRVIKTTFNDWGVEVDNMYLDNVARLIVLSGNKIVYEHDFRKQEFAQLVPDGFLQSCILRDMSFSHADEGALYYDVMIGIPDASTTYAIELRLGNDGKITKRLE